MARGKKETKEKKDSPFKLVLILLAIIGLAIWMYVDDNARRQTEPPATSRPPAAAASVEERPREFLEKSLSRLEKIEQDGALLGRALEAVAAGDPRGDLLIAFHREHAYYSVLVGNGVTIQHAAGNQSKSLRDPLAFEVTLATKRERALNGLPVNSGFEWNSQRNQLFALPVHVTTVEWGGILFAHELSHAYDVVTGVEPRQTKPSDRAYLEGELRAYEMEFRLADRLAKGAYRKTILTTLELRGYLKKELPNWIETLDDDFRRIDAVFPSPAKDRDEQSARNAMAQIALNFVRIEKQKGGREDRLAYISYLYGKYFGR
ncbi:hypothetical protein EPN90_04890 [Patescibacteria group bacterium]|nr:MAG: hypothetical protein EPN90_04890 [Patescibacteria group bacterium]